MITLGGNITLDGFTDRDYAELIVVKKIVGRYAREISDKQSSFENLNVVLTAAKPFTLGVECRVGGKASTAEVTDQNLFVALDKVLKKVVEQL